VNVPPLTWLYVPGDRADRVEKALASPAHAVIVDLEDGVPPASKELARTSAASLLDRRREKPVYLRVNGLRSGLAEADLEVAGSLAGIDAIALPEVEGPDDVVAARGQLPATRPLHCLIESAAGVEAAYEIASTDGVIGISLGEADLRSETGALDAGLDWARSRIVNAAVAAGLPRPFQSVYANVHDLDGLARSSRRGRALGHLGRAAIHPGQLAVIEEAYLPSADELAAARATIESMAKEGAGLIEGGNFVDAAMLGAARQLVALAERYGTGDP
jgi:citrate lyase subunit beta / citryl-CoA lyase